MSRGRRRGRLVAFVMGLLVTLSIGSNCETINPPTGPNTSYPCGVWGVSCPDNTCCPYKHECGGNHKGFFSTCPEGYCCYTGGDDWPRVGASPDGGAMVKARSVPAR